MAKLHYIPYEQGQTILFPQRIDEEIAENDLVRILNHIVEHLDLKMMLKIVLYAYMNNIYSCRKIERLLHRLFLELFLPQIGITNDFLDCQQIKIAV